MLHVAFRNLVQSWMRLIVSVGGVALAMLLILALDTVVAGTERQMTAYIDHSGAGVIVSQAGFARSTCLPRRSQPLTSRAFAARWVSPR